MCAASNWLWNFGIGYASKLRRHCRLRARNSIFAAPYLVNDGPGNANLGVKVFFIWGTTCLCCILFAFFCVPETKGTSMTSSSICNYLTHVFFTRSYA